MKERGYEIFLRDNYLITSKWSFINHFSIVDMSNELDQTHFYIKVCERGWPQIFIRWIYLMQTRYTCVIKNWINNFLLKQTEPPERCKQY